MLTQNDIKKSLDEIRAPRGNAVIVHSAMSLVGEVEGGILGFLNALIEYFTSEGGLLLIPTHTWDKVGVEKITLDMTRAETNLGALSAAALADGRGVRSENPTHSVVVFGDRRRALEFIECEKRVTSPTAKDGCYARLGECGGVLLVGVSQTANTYLHAVDEMLGRFERLEREPMSLAVRKPTGEVVERQFYMFDEREGDLSYRFDKLATAFRYHGATRDFYIGNAPSSLCDSGKMKEVVELIYSRSNGYDPLADEKPIHPSLYRSKSNAL